MEFVTYNIVTAKRFRALAIIYDYFQEYPAIEVDTSPGGCRVVRVLEKLVEIPGRLEVITIDNRPEFTSRAPDERVYLKGVKLNFVRSRKPI